MPAPDGLISSRELCNDIIAPRHISDGAFNDVVMFDAGIQPVQKVTSLPTCSAAETGQFAYLTTDGLLYKCDGSAWINVTDTSEITGQITTTQIEDDAITTPKIAANQVTAAKIAALTITAAEIAANTITAGQILAGTITATELAALAVTVPKLIVSSFDNLIVDPIFQTDVIDGDDDPNQYDSGSGGTWSSETTAVRAGARAARFDADTQSAQALIYLNGTPGNIAKHMSAAEGDTFYLEGYARYIDTASTVQPIITLRFYDKDGVQVGTDTDVTWPTLTTSYVKQIVSATAPANTAYVLGIAKVPNGNAAAVAILFDSFYMRRMIGSGVIDELWVDTLTLSTNGLIRTAASGNRIELTASGNDRIRFYSGDASEHQAGYMRSYAASRVGGTAPALVIRSPGSDDGGAPSSGSLWMDWLEPTGNAADEPQWRFGYDGPSTIDPQITFHSSNPVQIILGGTYGGNKATIQTSEVVASQMESFPGTLVKLDPPTWKATTTSPAVADYEDNSVGYYCRVGNVVFFWLHFIFDAGVTTGGNGTGDYYWDPAADGAPVATTIVGNTEDRFMICGAAQVKGSSSTRETGVSFIHKDFSRIQGWLDERDNTVSDTNPFGFDAGDTFEMSGHYFTSSVS